MSAPWLPKFRVPWARCDRCQRTIYVEREVAIPMGFVLYRCLGCVRVLS